MSIVKDIVDLIKEGAGFKSLAIIFILSAVVWVYYDLDESQEALNSQETVGLVVASVIVVLGFRLIHLAFKKKKKLL